jgi:hypothetical protein
MIRNLLIIAGASFVLTLGCAAGVAALAGPTLMKDGWTITFDDEDSRDRHVNLQSGATLPTVTRSFTWSGGDLLHVDVPCDVEYVQGPAGKIEIRGPKDLVEGLKIAGGVITLDRRSDRESLTIDRKGIRVLSDADRLQIVVTAPGVRRFQLDGSGDLNIRDFDQPELTVTLNGSGEVSARGRTTRLVLTSTGSGAARLDDLKTRDAVVALAGSGEADIAPTGAVKVNLSGSGDLNLETEAASVVAETSGSGSVHHNY